jgi:Holliday junction resolvase
MRRAAKVDENQAEIVAALRQVGCFVEPLHAVGGGVPDLLVGRNGETFLIEVKDGNKPPSARKKTDAQVIWHDAWRGKPVAVVCNIREALDAIGVQFRGQIS